MAEFARAPLRQARRAAMTGTALIVIAKAPVPGRVKTRLCPPCTREQAAALARGGPARHARRGGARRRVARRVLVFETAAGASGRRATRAVPAGVRADRAARRRAGAAAGGRVRGCRRSRRCSSAWTRRS